MRDASVDDVPAAGTSTPLRRISWEARLFIGALRWLIKPLLRILIPLLASGGLRFCGRLLELATAGFSRSASDRRILGGVTCDVVTPSSGSARLTVLFLHGGGFAMHAPNLYRRFGQLLADRLDAEVVIPDYRLAPAHRFPAAVDDCHAVHSTLLARGDDPSRLVLMGDSAGGNLTLCTLLRARDVGLPMPACAVPLSPSTDLSLGGASVGQNAALDPMIPAAILPQLVSLYASDAERRDRHASPAFADYAGLPPMAFFVGSTEVLLDDSRMAVAAALRAGVAAELHVWPEMPHVFPLFQFIPEAREALDQIVAFVMRHTGAHSTTA